MDTAQEFELRHRICDELIDYDYAPDTGDSAVLQDGIGITEITEFIKDEIKIANRNLAKRLIGHSKEYIAEKLIETIKG